MGFCIHCGGKLADGQTFCFACGKSSPQNAPHQQGSSQGNGEYPQQSQHYAQTGYSHQQPSQGHYAQTGYPQQQPGQSQYAHQAGYSQQQPGQGHYAQPGYQHQQPGQGYYAQTAYPQQQPSQGYHAQPGYPPQQPGQGHYAQPGYQQQQGQQQGQGYYTQAGYQQQGNNQYANSEYQKQGQKSPGGNIFDQFTNTPDSTGEFDPADIEQNKGISIVAYLFIFFFVPLVIVPNSKFARFHANQGLLALITLVCVGIIYAVLSQIFLAIMPIVVWRVLALLLWVPFLIPLGLMILGIVNCLNGQAKNLPLIGAIRIIK